MSNLLDDMNIEEMSNLLRMATERPCSDPAHEKIISVANIAVRKSSELAAENEQLKAQLAECKSRVNLLENNGKALVRRVNNLKLAFPDLSTMFDAGTADMRAALAAGDSSVVFNGHGPSCACEDCKYKPDLQNPASR